jgi:hypothetical protein
MDDSLGIVHGADPRLLFGLPDSTEEELMKSNIARTTLVAISFATLYINGERI